MQEQKNKTKITHPLGQLGDVGGRGLEHELILADLNWADEDCVEFYRDRRRGASAHDGTVKNGNHSSRTATVAASAGSPWSYLSSLAEPT